MFIRSNEHSNPAKFVWALIDGLAKCLKPLLAGASGIGGKAVVEKKSAEL